MSEAFAGALDQRLTLGSLVDAIPLTAMMISLAVSLIARLVFGVSASLLWALLAGYATRPAPERLAGRIVVTSRALPESPDHIETLKTSGTFSKLSVAMTSNLAALSSHGSRWPPVEPSKMQWMNGIDAKAQSGNPLISPLCCVSAKVAVDRATATA